MIFRLTTHKINSNKLKKQKYHTVGTILNTTVRTIPKSNIKVVERSKIDTLQHTNT